MAAPTKAYARRWDINFTGDQAEALESEALLRGVSVGDVVREAVARLLAGSGESE